MDRPAHRLASNKTRKLQSAPSNSPVSFYSFLTLDIWGPCTLVILVSLIESLTLLSLSSPVLYVLLLTLHLRSLFTLGSFTVTLFVSLFTMSSPSPSLRKRGGKKEAYTALPSDDGSMAPVSAPEKPGKPQSEWDYWLAMTILTALAFATRFYRIDYPSEVVFDEVHFGKVSFQQAWRLLDSRKGAWADMTFYS